MRAVSFALSALLVCLAAGEASSRTWPDRHRTPGVANPKVTQANIKRTICRSGWTGTIRPPTSYTNTLKVQGIADYGYSNKKLASYEEDHLISLQLGGHPRDPDNLWPQAYAGKCGARVKDRVETKLKTLVCRRQITLAQAQQMIAHNWVATYNQYIGELDCPTP
jgi:hypothetical protein